jgi:predicted small metal-binding protein
MQAESNEEVLEMAVAHAHEVHPEMAEGKSDEDLKAMLTPMIMEA